MPHRGFSSRGGHRGRGRGRGGNKGKRKRKLDHLRLASMAEDEAKRRKIAEAETEEQNAFSDSEEEEEKAYDALLGVLEGTRNEEDIEEDDGDEGIEECSIEKPESDDENQPDDSEELVDKIGGDEVDVFEENEDNDSSDRFVTFFQTDLEDSLADSFKQASSLEKTSMFFPKLGKAVVYGHPSFPEKFAPTESEDKLLARLPQRIGELLPTAAKRVTTSDEESRKTNTGLSELQRELLTLCLQYRDVAFCGRDLDNGEEIRFVYAIHALGHVMKSNRRVLRNNAKIKAKIEADPKFDAGSLELRDCGFVRPKVLIVVPFRDSALKIVNMMIDVFIAKPAQETVSRKAKFLVDYGPREEQEKHSNEDFSRTFSGNTDDNFKIGISVSRASMKLYAPLYASDIIIASPLGLRTSIGGEGDVKSDYDFLSSIEILILDQTDVFHMQNWDHIDVLFRHLHLQPKVDHGCDYSRVRNWSLNGLAKIYRQSLIFGRSPTMEVSSIINKCCLNYRGKLFFQSLHELGSIHGVLVQVPQKFYRFTCARFSDQAEARFQYFVERLMPKLRDPLMAQTLVFVPSYFDFVRLRNYFRDEELSFAQICEYSKPENVSRSRNRFSHKTDHFLLYTERFHFYHRIFLRGIRHLVFYQPPLNPRFYNELINFMSASKMKERGVNFSVSTLYSHFDALRVSSIVGGAKTPTMIQANSSKNLHTFVTE